MADDLNTPRAIIALDKLLADRTIAPAQRLYMLGEFDTVLGLNLTSLTRADLRVRPASAGLDAAAVEERLAERRRARAAKEFARSDRLRDDLAGAGVEVMDGDPLGWDWKPTASFERESG